MNVEYTEYKGVTKTVDIEQFWIEWLSGGLYQAEKNWKHYLETKEPYCYGRNRYHPILEEWSKKGWQCPGTVVKLYQDLWDKIMNQKYYE